MAKGKKNIESTQILDMRVQLARALADYDNLRKRVEKENEALEKLLTAKMLIRILPILDMLEDAQKHLEDAGIAMIIEEFRRALKDEGLESINSEKGSLFDENLHEVIETVEGGESGKVAEEVLAGWKFVNGPVVRVAKVKVFSHKSEKNDKIDN